MTLNYIIEICVGIDIAILGIAYPVIVDRISNIGDKYDSNYLFEVFKLEFPHSNFKIKWFRLDWSIFKTTLILTILSFVPLILNLKPLFGWNNWVINNSAELIILTMTSILTILFFIWIDKVSLFNGRSTKLLNYIIKKYKIENHDYYLKTINEFTIYSIRNQDEHIQKTLLEFYNNLINDFRIEHIKSNPLEYPDELYQLIYKINLELVNIKNIRIKGIENRAISGAWLLSNYISNISVSDKSYTWLWSNIYLIHSKHEYIKMFWANSNQYFRFNLDLIEDDFDYMSREKVNEFEIKKRNEEREQFLEFHFALGGLLMFKKEYQSLNYILNFSQSSPPIYVLLPSSMTEIFKLFEHFSNEYKLHPIPIDNKYYFPDLDNLGNRQEVVYWICSYLTLLFVRQYSLTKSFRSDDFISQPVLPIDISELKNWNDMLPFFKNCLENVCENDDLLTNLNFKTIIKEHKSDFTMFIDLIESNIYKKIGYEQKNAEISESKKQQFIIETTKIISESFNEYEEIFQDSTQIEKEDCDLKLSFGGSKTLFQKSAFTEAGIQHLNFDRVFAETISKQIIKKEISNSFLIARTRRYLVNKENLNDVLKNLNINKEEFFVLIFNPHFELQEFLQNTTLNIRRLKAIEFRNTIFILRKSDLPAILHLKKSNFIEEGLVPIDDIHNVYVSVLDLNKPENNLKKQQWPNVKEIESKVEATIAFNSIILWKKNRDVVQININTHLEEQGVISNLDEIAPFVIY